MMRILYLGNNWVGWQVLSWLKEQGEDVVGLVLHPPLRRKYGEEIMSAGQIDPALVVDGSQLRSTEVLDRIRQLKPDIGISAFFGYILKQDLLDLLPAGCINIHPALLPYNRGANPNVWSIVDETPAGVTIHYVDQGIDTGAIVAQQEVPVEATDTGESLYRKLEKEAVRLFKKSWPLIKSQELRAIPQAQGMGTYHSVDDLARTAEIDLTSQYKGKDIINALRARTFPPYPGAYFRDKGKKVYLRLDLVKENSDAGPVDAVSGDVDEDVD